MFDNIEKLEIINALYGVSSLRKRFENRLYHALIFKIDGESIYTFNSKKITLKEGNVLFIPRGASYLVTQTSSGESHYALINFVSSSLDACPHLYTCGSFDYFKHAIDGMIRASLFNDDSGKFEKLSLFYKIIAVLYHNDRKKYCGSNTKGIIKPAIDYLETRIFDSNLKVADLHTMCNISDTYFRQIFISVYGVSPKKHVQNKRLVQAKNILDSGAYTHIYEVANAVGFNDALYFSKSFKNKYGYFPSRSEIVD